MRTRLMVMSRTSGEVYAVRYDEQGATCCGPLHYSEQGAALGDYNYDDPWDTPFDDLLAEYRIVRTEVQ